MSRRAEIARAMGFELERLDDVRIEGRAPLAVYRMTKGTNEDAISIFNAWAHDEATLPDIRELAARIVQSVELAHAFSPIDRRVLVARKIQAYVQEFVAFHSEPGEVSRRADITLQLGKGDCDDSAVLVVALDTAAGLAARVYGIRDGKGDIVHAAAAFDLDGRTMWQEASVHATLGEHPRDAAKRLRPVGRGDIPR